MSDVKVLPPLLLLLLFPCPADTANILVCVSTPGSHLYLAATMAEELAEAGHNVTLFTTGHDSRVDLSTGRKYHFLRHPEMVLYNSTMNQEWEKTLQKTYKGNSENMYLNLLAFDDDVARTQAAEFRRGVEIYEHPFFTELLEQGGFDLVVVETTAWVGVPYQIMKLGLPIPTVSLHAMVLNMDIRIAENMPSMLNSEPNLFNSIGSNSNPPSFRERLTLILSTTKLIGFFMSTNDIFKGSVFTLDMITARHEMHFAIGHPALSFPSIIPANMRYLGFFTLPKYQPKPLPDRMAAFMMECSNHGNKVVYVSFGSFLPDPKTLPWIGEFFSALSSTPYCYLFKAKETFIQQLSLNPRQFFIQNWMPQKDILATGKVSFFLSHCGNNGRLEASYFTVPIMCLPLFADQYFNSVLVESKHFGLLLTKEHILEGKEVVLARIEEMMAKRHVFHRNMATARDLVVRDPGSGPEVFHYHVENILKHGGARYLKNTILHKQSTLEIYNLDIFGAVALGAVALLHVLGLGLVWGCKRIWNKMRRSQQKPKTQ